MKKRAFTMVELIMVIVVMGILASVAIPRMERDVRQEAGDNILSAIRYTQHLALMDNKVNLTADNLNWHRAFWQISFRSWDSGESWYYTIFSNNDYDNNVDKKEAAIEPITGKLLYSSNSTIDVDESSTIFLTQNYGVKEVNFSDCDVKTGTSGTNSSRHIAFDYLGRPHKGFTTATNNMSTLVHEDCTIRFKFTNENLQDLKIRITHQTGYTFIVGQENL